MQVTFKHHQSILRGCWLTTTVLFSPEEHAIIKKRRLKKFEVLSGLTVRPVNDIEMFLADAIAPLCAFIAVSPFFFIWFISWPPAQWVNYLGIFGLAGIYHFYIHWWKLPRMEPTIYTIRDLQRNPTVSFWGETPADLLILEGEQRKELDNVKMFINASRDIPASSRYEL